MRMDDGWADLFFWVDGLEFAYRVMRIRCVVGVYMCLLGINL